MHSVSCVRTWALYQHLQPWFEKIYVLSTSNRHLLKDPAVMPPDILIRDANTIDYRTIFRRRKPGFTTERGKMSWPGRMTRKLQASYPTLLFFGEGGMLYVRNGIINGDRIIRKHRITHMISTFPPFADHLIAHNLKRRFPDLHWTADFRDLHVDPAQNNLFWRDYQRRKNLELLSSADMLTTVSQGLARNLGDLCDHVYVIPNGIHREEVDPVDAPEKFTICYTGSLFQDKRRPDLLFEALASMLRGKEIDTQQLEVWYAGKDGKAWSSMARAYGLPASIIVDFGVVPRKRALEMQRQAHINILLTYSHPKLTGNMTGKLYEYLEARRPLGVIINGPEDPEIETVIRDTGIGKVWYHGNASKGLQDYIAGLYATWGSMGQVPDSVQNGALEQYRWESIIKGLIEHMGLNAGSETYTHA